MRQKHGAENPDEDDDHDPDMRIVAPLVVEYYDWLTGTGGTDPKLLLSVPLTHVQKEKLLKGIDDVNVLWGLTAPIREQNERNKEAIFPKVPKNQSQVPNDSDTRAIASSVVEYIKWVFDQGGTPPHEILSRTFTPAQRKLLLARMDDVIVIYGITGPTREAYKKLRKKEEGQE